MTQAPARTAVLIGNGAFPHAEGVLTPLAAPAHDVSVLAGLLADPEICRFDAPQTLVDRDAKTIKQTLLRTLNGARPQDLVLLYYAGHGKLDGAQLYLCASDTEPETLAATAVSISDIREYVGRSACKQVVLILDCCFSGAAADEFRTRGELSDRIEAAASARGLYLLTSCANHETSLEHVGGDEGDVPYGVYTRMLADGILSGQADVYGDGRITPLELAKYLQSRIPGQTPRVSLIDAEGEEPVLAWTSWAQNDGRRNRVRTRLVEWYADEAIPEEVFYQAMGLLGRVPQNALERRHKRLLGMCADAGWDNDVFARGWVALEAEPGDPSAGLERFLTEQVAQGTLDAGLYLDAMRLLAAEPQGELQRRRKHLLTRFGRSRQPDVTLLAEAWQALDRHESPRAEDTPPDAAGIPPVQAAPSAPAAADPPRAEELSAPVAADLPRAEEPSAPEAVSPSRVEAPAAAAVPIEAAAEADAPAFLPEPDAPISREDQAPTDEGTWEAVEPEEDDPASPGDVDPAHAEWEERSAGAGAWLPLGRELAPWQLDELRDLEESEGEAEAADAEPAALQHEATPLRAVAPEVKTEPSRSVVHPVRGAAPGDRFGTLKDRREAAGSERGDYLGYIVVLLLLCGIIAAGFLSRDNDHDDYEAAVTTPDPLVPGADTLRAFPLPVSTYLARPQEVDFPAIGGMLERVILQAGADSAGLTADDHGYRFSSSNAQYVRYRLLITAPDTLPAGPEVPIEAVWYNMDGTVRHRDVATVTGSGWSDGLGGGADTIGAWEPGVYYLEILNQGQRVAMKTLEVVPDTTIGPIYELPAVSGRVTDLRFYDRQRTNTDGFLARTRFSSRDAIILSSWIQFTHPPARTNSDFAIQVVYFASDGRPVDSISTTGQVLADSTTTPVSFWGSYARQWTQGTYRAEYFVNGTRITTGIFDVY
jgi:hypothetical protein